MVASRKVTCVAGAALAAASVLPLWLARQPAPKEAVPAVMAAVVRPVADPVPAEPAAKALPGSEPRRFLVEPAPRRYEGEDRRRSPRARGRSYRQPNPYWRGRRGWRSYGYRDGYRRDGWQRRWSGRRARPRWYGATPRYRDRGRLPYPAWLDERQRPLWVRLDAAPPG